MSKLIVWLDIPVKDLDRAMKFYSNVLAASLTKQEYGDFSIGMSDSAGCLYEEKEEIKNDIGPLLYLKINGRSDDAENKTKEFGGQVLKSKHSIGPYGFRSIVKDSEGNRIALHSET